MKQSTAVSSQRLRIWQSASFTKSPATGITTSTACSYSATRNDETKECFALRPMTCPFQYQVFLNRQRSYRDLPMRLTETSTLFRNEDSGEMHGLIRVRQFTISEGHYILRPEQLEDEFRGCLELA